jgi:hypothetical protein
MSENDQQRPPPEPDAIAVDPARLAHGVWNHSKNKDEGECDCAGAYSSDLIPSGKIRKPFKFDGGLWVTVSLSGLRGVDEATAYRLTPENLFPRPATSYEIKTRDGDDARSDPNGFYDSIRVRHGAENYVIVGPPLRFVASSEPSRPEQMQLSLFGEAAP